MIATGVRYDKARYESECHNVIAAFTASPSPETLNAALAALNDYQQKFDRWIAPQLPKPTKTKEQ